MIGVFDSGVGGLTVLRALRERLPQADLVYLGDTARLPYGTKSADTVVKYARQATAHLLNYNIGALVVACNTATAHALPALQETYKDMPVIGVIEAGAQAASRYKNILVLATEGTVRSGAYTKAIHAINPAAVVSAVPATLLVALAEEGWHDGPETEAVIARYLKGTGIDPDAVVLGCTHFPLLKKAIRKVIGHEVALIDSAETTAQAVEKRLAGHSLMQGSGRLQLLATDGAERFARVAAGFLGRDVTTDQIRIINL